MKYARSVNKDFYDTLPSPVREPAVGSANPSLANKNSKTYVTSDDVLMNDARHLALRVESTAGEVHEGAARVEEAADAEQRCGHGVQHRAVERHVGVAGADVEFVGLAGDQWATVERRDADALLDGRDLVERVVCRGVKSAQVGLGRGCGRASAGVLEQEKHYLRNEAITYAAFPGVELVMGGVVRSEPAAKEHDTCQILILYNGSRGLGGKRKGQTIGVEGDWITSILDQKGQQLAQGLGHAVSLRMAEIFGDQGAVGECLRGDEGREPE